MTTTADEIDVSTEGHTLPVMDIMTGRAFITGKSGSGKSNTASVIAEKLLDLGMTIVIVDTDGEYYGLKQDYELLHVGGDDTCDVQVTIEHAEQLAKLAIHENVPIILDVSAYLDPDTAESIIEAFVRQLFVLEKSAKKPLLLFVEEIHEYIPEQGGQGDLGDTLIQVAKRGRKRGLGVCGMSQRPAAVDKDFITQCNWIVWHRLTWETDTQVVGRIMDPKYSESVQELEDGEAFLLTDWDEQVSRIKFQRKSTFDAGATPGIDEYEPPETRSVSAEFIEDLRSDGEMDIDTSESSDEEGEDEQAEDLEDEPEETNETDDPTDSLVAAAENIEPSTPSPSSSPSRTSTPAVERGPEKSTPAESYPVEFAHLLTHSFDLLVGRVVRSVAAVKARLARGSNDVGGRTLPDPVTDGRTRRDAGPEERPTLKAAIWAVLLVLLGILAVGLLLTM